MKRIYGLKESTEDKRDFVKAYAPHTEIVLPQVVDLRPLMPPIFHQGELGSCTANAGVSLRMFLLGENAVGLSRLNLYYNERAIEGNIPEDSGAEMRDIGKCLFNYGVCEKTLFPYDVTKFTEAPSAEMTENAAKYKIKSYSSLATFRDVLVYLAIHQRPVLMGMKVFSSFESKEVADSGVMSMPKPTDKFAGGHAVLIVGYKTENGKVSLIVRNSWGTDWGDEGHFYMPENYVTAGYAGEFWTIDA